MAANKQFKYAIFLIIVIALAAVAGTIFIFYKYSQKPSSDGGGWVALTQSSCNSAGGKWNECGSRCALDNQGAQGVVCTLQCEALCECGGIAGFNCPNGYSCKTPSGIADALGYCVANG